MTTNLVVRGRDDRVAFEDGPDRGRILAFGRDTGGAEPAIGDGFMAEAERLFGSVFGLD